MKIDTKSNLGRFIEGNHLTPTQVKMLAILVDGLPHSRSELFGCLWDDQSLDSSIQAHISKLRKKLRPRYAILLEFCNREFMYRLVRLLSIADKKTAFTRATSS